jgi:hypothetical protein
MMDFQVFRHQLNTTKVLNEKLSELAKEGWEPITMHFKAPNELIFLLRKDSPVPTKKPDKKKEK